MIWLTVRELRVRRWRAVLTGTAAVVGVALVSGTLIISDTADRASIRDDDLDVVRQILLLSGVVALLVGAFIVNVTLSVTLSQRTRELALLRCLGATRQQLRRSVLAEALLIGGVSSVVGMFLGLAVAYLLRMLINTPGFPGTMPVDGLVVSPRTIVVAVLGGCVVLALSALAPARRASRVVPVAALRDLPSTSAGVGGRSWSAAGAALTTAAVAVVLFAAATYRGPLLFLGAALTLVGARMLGPRLVAFLVSVVGLPLARALPLSGALGRQNAVRSPERTTATASTLMIGLALLTFVTVLGTSTKAYIEAQVNRSHVDFELLSDEPTGRKPSGQPMSADLVARLSALPELSSVVPIAGAAATVAGKPAGVEAIDPLALSGVLDVAVVRGSLVDLTNGGIGVAQDAAARHGWTIGSRVAVGLPGGTGTFTVRVVYRRDSEGYAPYSPPTYLVLPADFARLGGDPAPYTVLLRAADGASLGTARAAVDRVLAAYPGVGLHRATERAQTDLAMIDRAQRIYLTLTGLASAWGLFGIVTVLSLSIVERRRELGLLRAAGMTRRQVQSMIRAEAVIIAVTGAVMGIGVGTFFAWAAGRVFERSSSPTLFSVPVGLLALYAALAALAGVAAAAVPARLAGRVDVLNAIATE